MTYLLLLMYDILKTLTIAFFILGISCGLFILLHPVRFDAKIRASLLGQKGELWFLYFFGFLGIGVVSTPFTQEVFLRLWRWKKLIFRNSERTRKTPKPPHAPKTEDVTKPIQPSQEDLVKVPQSPQPTTHTTDTTSSIERPIMSDTKKSFSDIPEKKQETVSETPILTSKESDSTPEVSAPTTMESLTEKSQTDTTSSQFFSTFAEDLSTEKKEDSSFLDKMAKIVGEFRKKIKEKLKIAKRIYFKALAVWRRFSPMGKTFLKDLWNSFDLKNSVLLVRYGFTEPHIVGLTQGLLCQIAGIANLWGVKSIFVPVFNCNTILLRTQLSIYIYPWKVIWSCVRLASEKEFWKGIYEGYRWYRARANNT